MVYLQWFFSTVALAGSHAKPAGDDEARWEVVFVSGRAFTAGFSKIRSESRSTSFARMDIGQAGGSVRLSLKIIAFAG
jgi:hypothetical protein